MTQSDDGPDFDANAPAFPFPGLLDPDFEGNLADHGLSVRAYFAARILPSLIADKELRKVFCQDAEELGNSHYDQAAFHALHHADALIRALQQPLPPHKPVRKAAAQAPRPAPSPARPAAWDAPVPGVAMVSGRPVALSDKMVATLTVMAGGKPAPVAPSQANFFERHNLAVTALGLPAPRVPFRMMEITPHGVEALRVFREGGAA